LSVDELNALRRLRKQLSGMSTQESLETVMDMIAATPDNATFLRGL